MGINQTVPRPACRYSIAAAMNGFAVFPVFSKGVGPACPCSTGTTAFGNRTRSQPRQRGCSKGLGRCPNKQKLRFPATPGAAVSSLCGYKDTACHFGASPGNSSSFLRQLPKPQWEGIELTMHCPHTSVDIPIWCATVPW